MTDDVIRCPKCGHDEIVRVGQTSSNDWRTAVTTVYDICGKCGDKISVIEERYGALQ